MWAGKERGGDKKKFSLGRNIFLLSIFSVHPGAVKQLALHVGFEELFCEGVGGVNFGDNCITKFQLL